MSQSMEYDRRSNVYRLGIDPTTSDSVGTAVVRGVASIEGVEETSLPHVHDAVDPDAVEGLLASARGSSAESSVAVEFPYGGYRITARPYEVLIRPLDPGAGPSVRDDGVIPASSADSNADTVDSSLSNWQR